jgi:hypothetical protein
MNHSKPFLRPEVTHLARFIAILLGMGLLWTPLARASQIIVPAFPSERFVDAWIEGELLLLKTEDGRLYSVPVGSVELESIFVEEPDTGPTVSDINELLLAGVSESTIKAYIESSGARFEISKDDILSLKMAGASEAFIRYLIFRGGTGPQEAYITWRGPSAPQKEVPPASNVQETTTDEYQSGTAHFPYVVPGFGAYYPVYPSHCLYPGYPQRSTKSRRDDPNRDLPPGAQPGYYWPETRSLMKTSVTRPGRPKSQTHHRGAVRTGGLWLRWKGGSNPNRSGSASRRSESYSSPNMQGAAPSSRANGTVGTATTTMSGGSSGRISRAPGTRSMMGSRSTTRSSGGTRSLISKKN